MRQDPPGSFLPPVLYGALGTCAFVLRNLFYKMVDRSFDGRRTGEFTVRIFLGMLSGLSLQWLVVRADGTVAGGITPAVLQERACSRETNCPKQGPTPNAPVAPKRGPASEGSQGPEGWSRTGGSSRRRPTRGLMPIAPV